MFERTAGYLSEKKHEVKFGLTVLGATLLGVAGAKYNDAHTTVDPIRLPPKSSTTLAPSADRLLVRMPSEEAGPFDCGGEDAPLGAIDNEKHVLKEMGGTALVECDLAADVPILDADGHPILG